jgi:hypothetical protein
MDSIRRAFDRLTERRRAAGVLKAVMSLVDDRRQFFKSAVGLAQPPSGGTPPRTRSASTSSHRHGAVEDARATRSCATTRRARPRGDRLPRHAAVSPDGEIVGSPGAIDPAARWSEGATPALGELPPRRWRRPARASHHEDGPGGYRFDPRALVDDACSTSRANGQEPLPPDRRTAGAWRRRVGTAAHARPSLERDAFTPAGHATRVRRRAALRVEVADSGIGIAPRT